MEKVATSPSAYSSREKKTSLSVVLWALAWGLSTALGCAAVRYLSTPTLTTGAIALCINAAIGLGAIAACIRWFTVLDEMQRKIWLESLAMAFGVLWISLGCLLILFTADIIDLGNTRLLGMLSMLAGLTMVAGFIISSSRHR